MAVLTLTIFLITKELTDKDDSSTLARIASFANIVISPMIMVFITMLIVEIVKAF
ncbi:hypothetical protein ACFLTT_03280 [Chloroflexota bacterium]